MEALAQHVRAWQRGGDEPFDEVHPVYLRATQELELLALAENQLLLDNAVVARKDYRLCVVLWTARDHPVRGAAGRGRGGGRCARAVSKFECVAPGLFVAAPQRQVRAPKAKALFLGRGSSAAVCLPGRPCSRSRGAASRSSAQRWP